MPISERGFDDIIDSFQSLESDIPVSKLMNILLAKNKSVVFMGDSMNTQYFTAMIEELKREGLAAG
jgi:hypothetical protein